MRRDEDERDGDIAPDDIYLGVRRFHKVIDSGFLHFA